MTTRFRQFLDDRKLSLRPLDDDHYRDTFDCGRDEAMTEWFSRTAGKWSREDLCAVWVLSPAGNDSAVYGFFTLSSHQINPSIVSRKHRAAQSENRPWVNGLTSPYPAQLLGKFAVDKDQQGSGTGAILMLGVFDTYLRVTDLTGSKFLVVDVQEPDLVAYYRDRYGFIRSSQTDITRMYLPTEAVRQNMAESLADEF